MVGAKTWARAPHATGDPISLEMSSAIPCMSLRMASATLVRTAPRSVGDMRGHGPCSNASRAAATARSTSAFCASGTLPISSSVVGETTLKIDEDEGSTHSPPMNRRSYDFMDPPCFEPDAHDSHAHLPGGAMTADGDDVENRSLNANLTHRHLDPGYAPDTTDIPVSPVGGPRPVTTRNRSCSLHLTTIRSTRSRSQCASSGLRTATSTTATTSTSMAPEGCTEPRTSCSP